MNGFQKVIKVCAICFAIFLIVNICGWIIFGISCFVYIADPETRENETAQISDIRKEHQSVVFSENEYTNINRIQIDSKFSEIYISKVNNHDLSVETDKAEDKIRIELVGGTLKIKENEKWFFHGNNSGRIKISIPDNFKLGELDLDTGAGKVSLIGISASKLNIDHGARKA